MFEMWLFSLLTIYHIPTFDRAWLEDYGVSDPKINVPNLLIMGEKDYSIKFGNLGEYTLSGQVKHFVPNLEMTFIPEGTHFVEEQFPEEVNNLLLNYLNKHIW